MNDNVVQGKTGRWYKVNDAWVPSVTTILSVYPKGTGFDRWLGESSSYDEAIAKRDAAGDRGALVHEAIAALVAGNNLTVLPATNDRTGLVSLGTERESWTLYNSDPRVAKFIQGFVNWWESCKPEPIAVEVFLAGDGYAGTCDFQGRVDGEPWLIDWKTSARVYASHHLQTAAYAAAAPETKWRRGILHLKTSTKKGFQLVESDGDWLADWNAFLACKTIYHRAHGYEPIPYDEKPETPTIFRLEQ